MMQTLFVITFTTLVSVNSQFSNLFFGNNQNQQPYNQFSSGFPQFNPQINQQYNPQYAQQYNPQYGQIYRPQSNQNNQQFNSQLNANNFQNRVEQSPSTNQRISERKCKEYQSVGQDEELEIVGSLSHTSSAQTLKSECQTTEGLIVGGKDASAGEFPHMVAIGYRNLNNELSFDCGGSLISERFVLSAAHCRYSARTEASVVRVGDLNLKLNEPGLPELDVPIASFINHERYDGANRKNDIAVIRLVRDVEFSKFVKPACLMTKNSFPQNKAIASGWGFTDPYFPKRADHLQQVGLQLIDYSTCNQNYNLGANYNLDSTQLCAGGENSGKDTCGGDSGGPLQIISNENSCTFTIVGVTSFGNKYCGGSPGVYTKVSAYIDWIEQKVWRS